MPRKPLEPDDRLRNCLPLASGRGGGDNPGASEERGFGGAPRMNSGAARKAGRNPARASGLSQLR